jgi:diguanylate cyclase
MPPADSSRCKKTPGSAGVRSLPEEFLTRVKVLYPDTFRIILSGYTDLATVTSAINEGAIYKFLTKPWNDGALRRDIRQAFRLHSEQHVAA